MQVTKKSSSPTSVTLTLIADESQLTTIKEHVLKDLAKSVRIQGFRNGKAPLNLIERSVDPSQLQTEFLEHAVNDLYVSAIEQEKLRPVAQPEVSIVKFVPFTTLEITAEVSVVGEIKLPDYKTITVTKDTTKVSDKEIDEVIKDLQTRAADRSPVDRAIKNGDEAVIDFKGVDAETKESIPGADGNDYPLGIGSNSFIPGFEEELIGLKAGGEKTFDITFPTDYSASELQNKKVTFTVNVKEVKELVEPKLDDEFAAKVGPFKTVDELKKDVRRELEAQGKREADRKLENDLVEAVAKKTKVEIPAALIDEEIDRIEQQERQDLVYRGQTWQEHLDIEGVTEEEHRERNREGAEMRVKAGLVLGEIADAEKITVSPEELEIRIQILKGQYATDERMLAELDKPENRRDVMSRLMTEKTLDKLKSFQK